MAVEEKSNPSDLTRWKLWLTSVCAAALLCFFAALALLAAQKKSATFDEPLHLVGGYLHRSDGDFRVNPEDPALFGYLAALRLPGGSIQVDHEWPKWKDYFHWVNDRGYRFATRTLFETPANRGDEIMQRARVSFIFVGVILGAVIAWWSWRLAGAGAAMVALILYCFDPNFLAHSALVKNDVVVTLALLLGVIFTWQFGRRGTWLSLLGMALSCAAAVNLKFSGLILGPIVFSLLMGRAMLSRTWIVGRWRFRRRWQRALLVTPAVCIFCLLVSYIGIWACYRFRYTPTDSPTAQFDMPKMEMLAKKAVLTDYGKDAELMKKPDDWTASQPIPLVDALAWIDARHLLPQTWTYGFLQIRATMSITTLLMGNLSNSGWWYYFPFAMLFKTPTATILALFLAAVSTLFLWIVRRNRPSGESENCTRVNAWSRLCLLIPVVIYGGCALAVELNIGLRHILPIYPFIYVIGAMAIVRGLRYWPRAGGTIAAVLALGLASETLRAYPNYIGFFNTPSTISITGFPTEFFLLGDSNLDWGQDLKQLANWQRRHPMRKMYLNYFGTASPAYYGVHATHMPGGYMYNQTTEFPTPGEPCWVVISATNLAGMYYQPDLRQEYVPLLHFKPKAIIGRSLYVYELPMPPGSQIR